MEAAPRGAPPPPRPLGPLVAALAFLLSLLGHTVCPSSLSAPHSFLKLSFLFSFFFFEIELSGLTNLLIFFHSLFSHVLHVDPSPKFSITDQTQRQLTGIKLGYLTCSANIY